jgi:hypothetical protein
MSDRVNLEEVLHDTSGVDPTPYMVEALNDIVDRLLSGERVGKFGLQDFLEDQIDLAELVSAAVVTHDFSVLDAEIERRLRVALEDDDAVHDRAVELAQGRDE